jgi:RNA polymerase sigma-70 factor, ECF subfamily
MGLELNRSLSIDTYSADFDRRGLLTSAVLFTDHYSVADKCFMVYGVCMTLALEQSAFELPSSLVRVLETVRAMAADFIPVVFGDACPAATQHDGELVRKSRNGDQDAYAQFVEKHQAAVSRIMWRFSRDAAVHEELVQDVFVEAYLSMDTYAGKAPIENWLARIATRVGYRHWTTAARDKRSCHLDQDQWNLLAKDSPDVEDPMAAAELLHALLAELPPRDRLILTLRYLENCSIDEAAMRAGWSRSMAKVQCWRAMKKLTALFEKYRKETGI